MLRATAQDQAGNQASSTQRSDGQQMAVTLPLRIPSTLQAGFDRRVVKQVVRRNGKRRTIRRRVTELKPRGVIRLGGQRKIAGRLTNRDGQGVPGAEITCPRALRRAPSSSSVWCKPTRPERSATRPPGARVARCASPTPARR